MPKRKMTNEPFIDIELLKRGLHQLKDTTKAPIGSAREMKNMRVTDRGGIAPRLGTELLGDDNSNGNACRGLFNFRKSYDSDEFFIKAYDDELEVYSKNHASAKWWRLKNGFTANKHFGFATSLVNTLNEDYTVFCNRFEPYQRWQGAVTLLNGALSGAETALVVDSTLTDEVFDSQTATGSAATTLDVATWNLPVDLYNDFYVYITSGTLAGKVRKITDTTATQIVFDTLGSDPSNPTFEIRKLAFPTTGSVIYDGTVIAYTGIDLATTLTVASAHAGTDNAVVALVPTEYPAAPRGNRMANHLARIAVGNVRSAQARNAGGTLAGYSSAGSMFLSKLADPFDFGFSASRVAGEGDVVAMPYGGGDIVDVIAQEELLYVIKKRYIEEIQYSQDSSDLAVRKTLKSGIGSTIPVIVGSDDIYFVTADNKLTSMGRVVTKDVLPQTDNIGHVVKRLLDGMVFDTGRGIEDEDRVYVPAKSDSTKTTNDVLLVYNKQNKAVDGIWDLAANYMERFDGNLYLGESVSPNVLRMNIGHADVVGTRRDPIVSRYKSNFMNLGVTDANAQALNAVYFEGYIKAGSKVTFEAWKDFSLTSFLNFDFEGTETNFVDSGSLNGFLGGAPLGSLPIGTLGEILEDGRQHFMFRVYFPFQYGNHFSIGFKSDGADLDYEITRYGLGLREEISLDTSRTKNI